MANKNKTENQIQDLLGQVISTLEVTGRSKEAWSLQGYADGLLGKRMKFGQGLTIDRTPKLSLAYMSGYTAGQKHTGE